jgi:hypothetical protein
MGFPNLVVPFKEALIGRLRERVIAVRVDDPSDVVRVSDGVSSSNNRLTTIILDSRTPLDEIHFDESWAGTRLAVFAPEMGHFRALVGKLELIRKIDPVIYLPTDNSENLSALRILSSVGVRSAALFIDRDPIDWEGLADLMTYSLVGAVAHASIEPFSTISGRYRPATWVEWGSAFFDNPRDFFHLDSDGRISLTRRELLEGTFVEEDLDRLDDIVTSPAYRERIDVRKRFFLDYHPCSLCPGWRICLGKFSRNGEHADGCAAFFTEMIDLLDLHQRGPESPKKERHDHRHL